MDSYSVVFSGLIPRCDLRVGQVVRMAWSCSFKEHFPGTWVVTSIRCDYQHGTRYNIEIAAEDEIRRDAGATDGFSPSDLEAA